MTGNEALAFADTYSNVAGQLPTGSDELDTCLDAMVILAGEVRRLRALVNPDLDLVRLRAAVGKTFENIDPRIDLPLEQQVELLMRLACAHRPEFRRSVPVQATDHDVLLASVLAKFVALVDVPGVSIGEDGP